MKPNFSFCILSSSPYTPRPTVRGLVASGSEYPGESPYGWSVPDRVDDRLAPPESALVLMESGAVAAGDRAKAKSLAAEFRSAIAAGKAQADDAEDQEQVDRCVGNFLASSGGE